MARAISGFGVGLTGDVERPLIYSIFLLQAPTTVIADGQAWSPFFMLRPSLM